MRALTTGLAGKVSILLVAAFVLTIMAPAYSADKIPSGSVAISSITDKLGSVNINIGKGEGLKEGAKGTVVRDGKEIAKYVVQQVNWGFSRITLYDVAEGYTVRAGDSAPLTPAAEKPSVPKKKSSKSKTILTILAIGAAALLLGGGGGGHSSDAAMGASGIVLTSKRQSTVDGDNNMTCVVTITARVNDANGFPVPDGTAVTFSSNAGTLNHTQTTTSAGKAYATLTYDPAEDPDDAVVTVRALGQTNTTDISFISSIDLVANPTTIQIRDSGGDAMQSTITATCWDSDGHPATSGTVSFTATRGTVTPSSAAIGANGTVTATYTSTVAGDADITATWGKNKATTTVTVTAGPPQSLTVSADTVSVQCDGSSFATISATVKDARGNMATDGTMVNFSVAPVGPGGNGTITPQATTTNGVATAYLYTRDAGGATSTPGTARVTAQVLRANQPATVPLPVNDLTNQTTQVQFISMNVGEIHLSAEPVNVRGWDQVGNTTTIKAVVYNVDGQPVPDGTAVYFTATHGVVRGATSGNMGKTTNGQATATLTTDASGNGTWDGRVDVTASSGGVNSTAADLVIFSGAPTLGNCHADISQPSVTPVNGQAFITVTAHDVNDNPVADGTSVTATTNRGSITGNGTTTGGNITFTLTTSTDNATPTPQGAGVVNITITSGGGNPPVVLTVNFSVAP